MIFAGARGLPRVRAGPERHAPHKGQNPLRLRLKATIRRGRNRRMAWDLVKQRRFNRTNEFGVERFSSFWAKLKQWSQDYILVGGCLLAVAIGATSCRSDPTASTTC